MRCAILGNSGSGKSTLAERLAGSHAVPVLDLDTIYWKPGEIAVEREPAEREADLRHFCSSNKGWVVEGCYGDLIAISLEWEPELLFLDPGLDACIRNCKARPHEAHKYESVAAQDSRLGFLLQWVADYYDREGAMSYRGHLALFNAYPGRKSRITGPIS